MRCSTDSRLKLFACVVGAVAPALVAMVGTVSAADESFKATTAITLPTTITSFDISFVDAELGLYALGDRTGNAADVIDTTTNTLVGQFGKGLFTGPGACPPAKQPAGANDCAGPDGVSIINHRELWVGDGDSTVKVFELSAGPTAAPTHVISTGGNHRADELCFDPEHQIVLMANNAESPFPFATAISVASHSVIKRITFDGTNGTPKATNGAEQCQWSPRTEKFYISIPEINGNGVTTSGGGVAVIDPQTLKVEKTFAIDLAKCQAPQGMTIGPDHQILLGCNGAANTNNATVVIDERDGHVIKTLNQESGADEVWYNPGDGHYFLARSTVSTDPAHQLLGVVDAESLTADTSAITNGAGKGNVHSVAADPVRNQVYVPIPSTGNAGVCSSAGGTDTKGCIAVFTTPNDDKCFAEGSPVIRVADGDEDHMREGCRRHRHHDDD
jgi:hypothetical protein